MMIQFSKFDLKMAIKKFGVRLSALDFPYSDMSGALGCKTTYAPTPFLLELRDVYVLGTDFSIIVPGHGFLYEGLVFSDREEKYNQKQFLDVDVSKLDSSREIESGFLLGDNKNYYHWLVNYLPRYMFYPAFGGISPVVVSDVPSRFVNDSLAILGHPVGLSVGIGRSEIVRFKRLVVPVFFQNPMHSPVALSYVRNGLLKARFIAGPSVDFGEKIYLSRNDGGSRRLVKNEDDVAKSLSDKGFETVYAASLGLIEQVKIFSRCKYLVSPHGAGLINMLFMPAGANVFELQSKEYFTRVYWEVGILSGVENYSILACDSDVAQDRHKNHRDLIVGDEVLSAIVV